MSSRFKPFVSGRKAQKKSALVKLQIMKMR